MGQGKRMAEILRRRAVSRGKAALRKDVYSLKKLISALLCLVLAIGLLPFSAAPAHATLVDFGQCGDDLTWTLDDKGKLTISGTGDMWDWGWFGSPFAQRSDIYTVVIENKVTSIGDSAFYPCPNLKSMTIPDSVTSIGQRAFFGCSALTNVAIPKSVTLIDAAAFSFCSSLTRIRVSEENPVFNSIDGVLFDKSGTILLAFPAGKADSYAVADTVTAIGNWAFSGCPDLKSVTIPDSVTSIGYWAFYSCYSLSNVTIGSSVTSIGECAFYYCSSLASASIPLSVTSIGHHVFFGCNALKDIWYGGGKDDWSRIEISDVVSWPDDIRIHYHHLNPASELIALLKTKPSEYNDDLALIAANLSLKTYDNGAENDESVRGYLTYDLGFNKKNHARIYSNNYGGSLAYTVATRDYPGSAADKLLVIVCQGSTNPYELLKDATALFKSKYKGHLVYDIVQDFINAIDKGLDQVVEEGKRYIVLTTGHSLGGAAANLAAAKMTDQGIPKFNASCPAVFSYTFGAVNSIVSDAPVTDGYMNIHNVYNELDTFSPTQSGPLLPTGMGSRNGKFGQMDAFVYDYRTDREKKLDEQDMVTQALNHVNHDMDKYLDAVRTYKVLNAVSKKVPATPELSSVKMTKSGVQFKWKASDGAAKYRVYRKTGSGSWKYLAETSKTSYTDKKASAGKTYSYTVRAKSFAGKLGKYNKTGLQITYISPPELVSVKKVSSGVKFSWKAAAGAAWYRVYRKTGSGKWTYLAQTSKTSYTDRKAKARNTYSYTVRGKDAYGNLSAYDTKGLKIKVS